MATMKEFTGGVRVAEKATPKGPVLVGVRRKVENLDTILTSTFIVTPFDELKARDLLALLDQYPQLPAPELEQLKGLLRFGPQDAAETETFSNLLFALQRNLSEAELPVQVINRFNANMPITYILPPFNVERGVIFRELLEKLQPTPLSDEDMSSIYDYLDAPPNSQDDIVEFKKLLFDLLRSIGTQPPDIVKDIQMAMPIALIGPAEINVLKGLTFTQTNGPVFNLFNRAELYEAVSIIMLTNYTRGLEILRQAKVPEDLTFGSPLMRSAKEKYIIDLEILRTKMDVIPGTGQFECSRCHGKNVLYIEKQMRSADEPMNVKCTCVDCGHRWII